MTFARLRIPAVHILAFAVALSVAGPVPAETTFDEWKEEQEQEFESRRAAEDAAFSAFLREEWEAFEAFVSESYYSEPKLRDPPVTDKEVMGWDDVAVLHYPGHLAIVVPQYRLGIDGDSVTHNGVRYIITDPTYIGADIGHAMPRFRNVRPQVNVVSEGG